MSIDVGQLVSIVSRKDRKSVSTRTLLKELKVTAKHEAELERVLTELETVGVVVHRRRKSWGLRSGRTFRLGRLVSIRRRYGLVQPEGEGHAENIKVPVSRLSGALPGDRVLVELASHRRGRRPRPTARSVRGGIVLGMARAKERIVGRFSRSGRRSFLEPMGKNLPVLPVDMTGDVQPREGQIVVVSLKPPPQLPHASVGVVEKILGDFEAPGVDVESIIQEFGLRKEFPQQVLEEARRVAKPLSPKVVRRREDLRDSLIITIDPEEAADFDDALSLEKLANGGWQLGVHIADVGHYIKPHSALDEEARCRAVSVYLPGRVLSMLPPVLSSGMASLKEGQERLAKSVLMEIDQQGKLKSTRVVSSVIKSSARLSYEEAEKMLGTSLGGRGARRKVTELVKDGWELAQILYERRRSRGALDLDLPELKLTLDEADEAKAVKLASRLRAHHIIEEFMLLTNQVMAEYFLHHKLPLISRLHPAPAGEDCLELYQWARALGLKPGRGDDRRKLQSLLNQARGKELEHVVNLAVLRCLEKASYSAESQGHHALALAQYCHFTSPIRRYPDLIVQQILEAYLTGQLDRKRGCALRSALTPIAQHTSTQERLAAAAERALAESKVLKLLRRSSRRAFTGLVTGIVARGLFVRLDEYWVEGFLPLANLADDYYRTVRQRTALVGRRSGRRIRLASKLSVRIRDLDPLRRELVLEEIR